MKDRKVLSRDPRRYTLPSERALGADTHSYMPELCDQLETGKISRRDFLRQAALLGMAAGTAYAMAGMPGGGAIHSAAAQETPKAGGTLRVSMRVQQMTDPGAFDWTEKSNVARLMIEHLTRTGTDNVTVPYLAHKWEASDDLKTWVFHLHDGITWSNGDAFTAADVAHTVNRWLDPATGSSNLGLFSAMVEDGADGKKRGIANAVEVIDDHTIQFNLKQAALAMPENFYNYPTAIVHRGFGVDYEADLSQNPIGTGPFELAEFAIGEKATLKRARDWWAGPFYLDEVHYYDHGEDTNAWIAALASQQVDALDRLPTNLIETARALPFVDIHEATTVLTAVMRFRITEAPFDNLKLRQAVAACMDHAELLEKSYQGYGQIAENHHVCPVHPEYAALPPLTRDIEKAKALLAEAGYPDGITLEIANGDTEGPVDEGRLLDLQEPSGPGGHHGQHQSDAGQPVLGDLGQGALGLHRVGTPPARHHGARARLPGRRSVERVRLRQPGLRRRARRCRGHARRRGAPEEDSGLPADPAGRRDHPAALLALCLHGVDQAGQGLQDPSSVLPSAPRGMAGRLSRGVVREASPSRTVLPAAEGSCRAEPPPRARNQHVPLGAVRLCDILLVDAHSTMRWIGNRTTPCLGERWIHRLRGIGLAP